MQKYMSLESGGSNENSKSGVGYVDTYDESYVSHTGVSRISDATSLLSNQNNTGASSTSFSLGATSADTPSFSTGLFGSMSASSTTNNTKDRGKTKEPKSTRANV